MTNSIAVEINALNEPYWASLREGYLKFQSCACGYSWLPARKLCPSCLGSSWEWANAQGTGIIKSWVVFHVAYHPEFKDRLPYNVAIVKLDEGPQLITNIAAAQSHLRIGARVRLRAPDRSEQPLATFELTDPKP